MSTSNQPDAPLSIDTSNISNSERLDLEIKILASYLRGPSQVQKQILSNLHPTAYVYLENVWCRILQFVKEGVTAPDLAVILQDPNIDQIESGIAESSYHETPVETIEEIELLVRRIHEQYFKDSLVSAISEVGTKLSSSTEYTSASAFEELSAKLEKLAASMDEGGMVGVGLGYDPNSVMDILTNSESSQIIPTGFEGFDRIAGGVAKGELHINACPSSGGKTTLMNQMCINMGLGMKDRQYTRPPLSIFYISLEMSQREMWGRIIANLTGIPISRFRKPEELTQEELDLIQTTICDISKYLADNGHMFRFENADFGNIDAITRVLATHSFDVVIVDYLNLMADGENLWSSMGSIARSLKLLAQKRNFACITAAQLDEDSLKIRYSRMVKEHCDTIWLWTPSGGVKDANDEVISAFTEIFVDKGRNIGKFSFWLHFDFAHMIVNSVNPVTELGLNGCAPDNQRTQRLPGVNLNNVPLIGLNAPSQDTMATAILSQNMEQNLLTPPNILQADAVSATAGFNIAGSVPKEISQGLSPFETPESSAVYGDNAEGDIIIPKASTLMTAPKLTPLPTTVETVEQEDKADPWNTTIPKLDNSAGKTVAADEVIPDDNAIEL